VTYPTIAGRARTGSARRAGSPFLGIGLIVVAGLMAVLQDAFREIEASAVSKVLGLFIPGSVAVNNSTVIYGLGKSAPFGLLITTQCSTLVLWVPLLALAGILLLIGRTRLQKALAGLGVAMAMTAAANCARFLLIALAQQAWGMQGFDVVHHWFGSILVIIVMAAAVGVLLVMSSGKRTRRRNNRPAASR
jgi:exosortase/archaeosortase family protein